MRADMAAEGKRIMTGSSLASTFAAALTQTAQSNVEACVSVSNAYMHFRFYLLPLLSSHMHYQLIVSYKYSNYKYWALHPVMFLATFGS